MHRRGFNCLSYLDDFFLVEQTKERCTESMNTLLRVLRRLGFYISYKKLSPPAQSCRFLGIILDSVQQEARLPVDKMSKLHSELPYFSGKKRATLRQLQELTGILCHASKVIHGGRPFTHRIIQMLKQFKPGIKRIRIGNEVRLDLDWWNHCVEMFNGRTAILSSRITLLDPVVPIVKEDMFYVSHGPLLIAGSFKGSSMGYSVDQLDKIGHAVCDIQEDYRYELSTLRLLCVLCVMLMWGKMWSNSNVFVITKSRSLVRSLRKGCANNDLEAAIIRDLFWLFVYYDFRLIPFYI